MKRITMLLGAGVLLLSSMVNAAVPQLISFQGILKDANGQPVADGTYPVKFEIFDAVGPGGGCLWQENQSVTTQGGLFSVVLGSASQGIPDTAFNDSARWLAITVGNDPEISPRQRLLSVGYSYRVGTVDGATGGTIFGNTSIQRDLSVAGGMDAKSMVLNAKAPGPPQVVPLSILGSPGQSANLMEIKDDLGAILGSVDSKGSLFHRYGVFAHSVSCGETLSVDQLIATPAIQLKSFSTISNFPNPVPIEVKTSKGSMFIGRDDGVLQKVSADPAASVSKLTEWQNGSGATVASIEPSGAATFEHELGHNLSLCHNPPVGGFKFLECTNALGNPVASIDASGNMSIDGDMDGLSSNWENLQAIDINCDNFANTGDMSVGGNLSIGTAIANGKLHVGGAISTAVTVVSSPTPSITLDASHSVILCNAVLGTIFVNLPTAVGIAGRVYTIKLLFVNSGNVIIDPFGSETIEGAATYSVNTQYQYVTIVSDGANWWIVANN